MDDVEKKVCLKRRMKSGGRCREEGRGREWRGMTGGRLRRGRYKAREMEGRDERLRRGERGRERGINIMSGNGRWRKEISLSDTQQKYRTGINRKRDKTLRKGIGVRFTRHVSKGILPPRNVTLRKRKKNNQYFLSDGSYLWNFR